MWTDILPTEPTAPAETPCHVVILPPQGKRKNNIELRFRCAKSGSEEDGEARRMLLRKMANWGLLNNSSDTTPA